MSVPSLRDQAALRDRWLGERLDSLLPDLMAEAGLEAWIVTGREYHEDPVLWSLLPADWLSARRRTTIVMILEGGVVHRFALTGAGSGLEQHYDTVWDRAAETDAACLRRLMDRHAPSRIGIDTSSVTALADGLSSTEHARLLEALGPHATRVEPAEVLAVSWLGRRLPEEIEAAEGLNALAHAVIDEAFSAEAIEVGTTTAEDLAWWIRQRFATLTTPAWFQPTIDLQRRGAPPSGLNTAVVILPGDLLHCDVGLQALGLCTDTQRLAYVPHPHERGAPEGLVAAVRAANAVQDHLAAELVPGRTGNEILLATLARCRADGLDAHVYTHPIGVHGHGAGPTIGLWDRQEAIAGSGEMRLDDWSMLAMELAATSAVAEWDDQRVRVGLEQVVAVRDGRVDYLAGRQTDLPVVAPG